MTGVNIDKICAEVGFGIPQENMDKSKQENVIRKALGVLSSDGIFAYVIWAESKAGQITWNEKRQALSKLSEDEKCSRWIILKSISLLKQILPTSIACEQNDVLEKIFNGIKGENSDSEWNKQRENLRQELTKNDGVLADVYRMFFVKQMLERMLTYALYRAKSLE
ncbi:MAG: hypothetical protein N3D85_07610 [Candidatus Bathyarchaeota archaeon]|nr:hypothetical protein [Candidatus Bathyarchaeota archaeon]